MFAQFVAGSVEMAPKKFVGNYFVKPTSIAITRAWKLCGNKMREYQILRRHAFKLAWWPTGGDEGDPRTDLDWDWITNLERKRIGELRIDEPVNGNDNVRVVFFKSNVPLPEEPMNRIWLLTVFQKKRQGFTNSEMSAFRAMRDLIVERHYGGSDRA